MANYVISIMVDAKDKNVKQVLGGVGRELQGLGDTAESTGDRMGQAFTGAGIAMAFGQAIPLIKSAIGAYNELRAGMVGLESVVRFTGESWDDSREALQEYISDGLIPMTDATTALKNLLLRGYGLEKSIKLLGRLKDAAAFGRQGQLSMGQAIKSAAEGLKNENSILVDNAGVTKNVSVMWKEYAASIGTTVGKLTQAQKLQAEYNGIIAETAPMIGNAAKLTNELSGEMARFDATIRELKEAIGEAFAPAIADALSKATPFVETIKEFAIVNPIATQTLLGGSGLVAAVGALSSAFAIMGPTGDMIVGVAVGLLLVATAATALIEKLRRSADSVEKAARKAIELSSSVRELRIEYDTLEGKPDKSEAEHRRLKNVMEDLARLVPEAVKAFREEGSVLELNTSRLDEYVRAMEVVRDLEIEKYEQEVVKAQRERVRVQSTLSSKLAAYDAMLQQGITSTREFTGTIVEGGEEVYSMSAEMVSSALTIDELRNQIRGLAAELRVAEVEEKRMKKTLAELRGVVEDEEEIIPPLSAKTIENYRSLATYFDRLADAEFLMTGQEIQIWNETGEAIGEATQWLEQFYATKEAKEEASLARFEASFAGHLSRMGKGMTNWQQDMTGMIGNVGDQFAATWAAAASGNQEAIDSMKEYWEDFFGWLVGELMRIMVRWFIGKILAGLDILSGGRNIAGDIIGEVSGTDLTKTVATSSGIKALQEDTLTAGGVMMRGVVTGGVHQDRVPMYAEASGSSPSPAMAGAQGERFAEPADEVHYHFHSADYPSFARALRSGELGRELGRALRHGRLAR